MSWGLSQNRRGRIKVLECTVHGHRRQMALLSRSRAIKLTVWN